MTRPHPVPAFFGTAPSDHTGKRFGALQVLRKLDVYPAAYETLCDCGTSSVFAADRILRRRSCGCRTTTKGVHAGDVFGALTAIEPTGEKYVTPSGGTSPFWRLVCECGKERIAPSSRLLSGDVKSCGCAKSGESFVGYRAGRLVAVELVGTKAYGGTTGREYRCVCDCGGEKIVMRHHLKRGTVRSCGCLRRKRTL